MLPYLADRPVNLHRFPDGITKPGFWHKAAPQHAPDWLHRWRNEEADTGETEEYLVLDSPAALAWAANYGAIELHPWTSTTEHPHQPTWAMIDIDPGRIEQLRRCPGARPAPSHRTRPSRCEGDAEGDRQTRLQIWVPVATGYTFDDTRAWVERLSRLVGDTVPDMVSWEWEVAKRGGRIRLDYTQNAINKTLVAPFSARPAAGRTGVGAHLVGRARRPRLRPDRWTIRNIHDRLASRATRLRR